MIELRGLPKLPAGWVYEKHLYDPDVVHIVWPGHGAESINFRTRTSDGGWVIPRKPLSYESVQKGRKWKERLVMAAVAKLQAIWEPVDAADADH